VWREAGVRPIGGSWIDELIDAGAAAFEFLIDQQDLREARIERWLKKAHVDASVVTLSWLASDGLGRNIHLAAVRGSYSNPSNDHADVETNAWLDERGQSYWSRSSAPWSPSSGHRPKGVARRIKNERIGRMDYLTGENVKERISELQLLIWQGYGVVSRVTANDLALEKRKLAAEDEADPGPLNLEVWYGE
jgi:hypothetical protein